jgi:hypothetical protein
MKARIILFVVSVLSVQYAFGQHFSGAELYYEHIMANDYRVHYVYYQDCADPWFVWSYRDVTAKSTSNPSLNYMVQLTLDSIEVITQQTCTNYSNPCTGGTGAYGLEKWHYSGVFTLSPKDDWVLQHWACCRDSSNVSYMSPIFVYAQLNNVDGPNNTSPVFTEQPTHIAYANDDVYMNLGAIEPDGDSLSYSFFPPATSGVNSSTYYNVGYSDTNFTGYSTAATIDPITGQIWCKSAISQNVVMSVCVKEWRKVNGVYIEIGRVHRDIEIKFIGYDVHAPVLTGMTQDSVYNTTDFVFVDTVCVDEQVDFYIHAYDADELVSSLDSSYKNFSISWNQGIPGASFMVMNDSSDQASARFQWIPRNDAVQDAPHCFTARVHDFACDFNATNVFGYCIVVKGPVMEIVGEDEVCRGDTIMLVADSDHPDYYFEWEALYGILLSGYGEDTIYLNTDSLLVAFDPIQVEIREPTGLQCVNTELIVLEVNELPQIDIGNDTMINPSHSITLSGSSYYYIYNWSTGQQSYSIVVDSVWGMPQRKIYVDVVDSNGCHNSDTILISFGPQSVNEIVPDFMKIYPIPVGDILHIEQSNLRMRDLQLYSADGSLVRNIELTGNQTQINLSDLPAGVYYLMSDSSVPLIKRIVKL